MAKIHITFLSEKLKGWKDPIKEYTQKVTSQEFGAKSVSECSDTS